MSVESYFEDLEAQFAAAQDRQFEKVPGRRFAQSKSSQLSKQLEQQPILLGLQASWHDSLTLTHPVIGLDFVAGLHQARGTFCMVRNEALSRLTWSIAEAGLSAPIQKVASELSEFIEGFRDEPLSVVIYRESKHGASLSGWLVGRQLMLLELMVQNELQLVPLQSIQAIMIRSRPS